MTRNSSVSPRSTPEFVITDSFVPETLWHGAGEHPLVSRIRRELKLLPTLRYLLALFRISAKGNLEKLDDQRGTELTVYAHNPDVAALKDLSVETIVRTWIPISYRDLNPAASPSVFGWVGLVGKTLFVAVADSAVAANLPPDPSDPARLGRNAYTDLLTAVALAGFVSDIYAPMRSRWWRNDLWANMLMTAINRRLPGCRLWEGDKQVSTSGSEKIVTDLTGRIEGSGSAEGFAEQVYTKGIEHLLEGNQWDRRESELPLGLGRRRVTLGDGMMRKALAVEETRFRAVAVEALALRAEGRSWEAVGELLAERGAPMTGPRGSGRTFADFSTPWARTQATRHLFLRHLEWYRTGSMTVRRFTKLERDEVRGQQLQFDPATTRRYRDVPVKLPWRPFLSDEQWAALDRHEAADAAKKASSRKKGAATHDHSAGRAAFQGVPSFGEDETIAPESETAYRWRVGGAIEATLRRTLVHRGAGTALRLLIERLDTPLAAAAAAPLDDGLLSSLERRVGKLDAAIARLRSDAESADKELLAARREKKDAREIGHWRDKGEQVRRELWRHEDERAAATADLEHARVDIVETIETRAAEISEPLLLATLLEDGDKRVDPLVTRLCERDGISGSLRATWDDEPGGRRRCDQEPGRLVRLEATVRLPLLDGGIYEAPLSWVVEDSHATPGDGALVASMMRRWAAGESFAAIAARYPDMDAARVRKRLNATLRSGGVVRRDLRRSLLAAPVASTRAILAARVLHDDALGAPYSASLRDDVLAAYLATEPRHVDLWCDVAHLDEDRRVLEVLARGDLGAGGIDIVALARNAAVSRSHIWHMNRRRILEKVALNAVRARRCSFQPRKGARACGGKLVIYTPAPEAGLICETCWRPEGRRGQLGEEHTRRWVRDPDGSYRVGEAPAVSAASEKRDRLLAVTEVATRIGISAWGVRELDRLGELLPDSRGGSQGGRLYGATRIAALPEQTLALWRARYVRSRDPELLSVADVAALRSCPPKLVSDFAIAGVLPVAARGPNGRRLFRREDVDQLDRAGIDAYGLTPVGEAAASFGLPPTTLRDLALGAHVRAHVTLLGQRRFDLDELRDDLDKLGLAGSATNPIVGIGELAAHPEVRLSTGQIRMLTDRKVIRCAARLGGKRRYRLNDALDDIAVGRRAGIAPAPGGELSRGRRRGDASPGGRLPAL